jgi:hypothetical protein
MARISVDPTALLEASQRLRQAVAAAHDIRHERDVLIDLVRDAGSTRFSEGNCAEAYIEVEDEIAAGLEDE